MNASQIIEETCREYGTSKQEAFIERRLFSRCVIARQEVWVALFMQGWSTHEVAALTHTGQPAVWKSLKRAGVNMAIRQFEWTPAEIALLGTMADSDLSAEFERLADQCAPGIHRRSRIAISVKRSTLGIPSHRSRLGVSPEAAQAAKRMRESEWCERYGFARCTYYSTRRK